MTTRDDQNLKNITLQLASSIDSQIQFYSDDDRIYFIENVITILMTSDSASIKANMKNFVVENYENGYELSEDINEGIGSFVKGFAKGVGRVLGFGRPAEKIAFGAPPTTQDAPIPAAAAPTEKEKIIKRVPTTRRKATVVSGRVTKEKPGTTGSPINVHINNAANANTGERADLGRTVTPTTTNKITNTTTRDSNNPRDTTTRDSNNPRNTTTRDSNNPRTSRTSSITPAPPATIAKPTVDATRAADGSAAALGGKKITPKKQPKVLPIKDSVDPMAGYIKGYANRFLRG
jgi:hypothetical protein